ncbi:MAG: transporter, partial [Mycobacterium sp.]|nr:transporter [Mycobacterium sp.]
MTRRDEPLPDLIAAAREGSARAVARLISLVEDASPRLRELMELLAPLGSIAGGTKVIGLTGTPGVG